MGTDDDGNVKNQETIRFSVFSNAFANLPNFNSLEFSIAFMASH